MARRRKAEFEIITFNEAIRRDRGKEAVHSALMLPFVPGALLSDALLQLNKPKDERRFLAVEVKDDLVQAVRDLKQKFSHKKPAP